MDLALANDDFADDRPAGCGPGEAGQRCDQYRDRNEKRGGAMIVGYGMGIDLERLRHLEGVVAVAEE